MQDIANEIQVSRVTVSKVLNNNDGVSEDLKKKVIKTAKELGYDRVYETVDEQQVKKNIAIAVSRPDSSVFWLNIIHSIARELSLKNVNLIYTYLPTSYRGKVEFPTSFYDGSIDAVIVMNVYNMEIYKQFQKVDLPKVFLDTPDGFCIADVKGDIVYIAGRAATRKITEKLISKGNRKIGFIGDIYYASTNRDRYDGFLDAMNYAELNIDDYICHTSKIKTTGYKEEIERFLEHLISKDRLPEAFVCVSDFVAHFAIEYLEKKGYEIPEHIEITGFDGNREYMLQNSDKYIPTAVVDLGYIGKKLVRQALFRMENVDAPYEVCYIESKVKFSGV